MTRSPARAGSIPHQVPVVTTVPRGTVWRALRRDDDNAVFTREVGGPVAQAIRAFAARDFAHCAQLLRRIRSRASRFGGSHAQRDVIDLTLLEAARRGGQEALASALAFERLCVRPRRSTVRPLAA